MNISGQLDFALRTQSRLDGKWIKTDLQQCFNNDGLALLWNDMIKDGELIGSFSDGILNSVGVTAKKGSDGFTKNKFNIQTLFLNKGKSPFFFKLLKMFVFFV